MQYKFEGIYNDNLYKTANVVYILGQYEVFNNIVIDRFRDMAVPKVDNTASLALVAELSDGLPTSGNLKTEYNSSSNIVDFDTFMSLRGSYPLQGRYYCSVDYDTLTKKQMEQLSDYNKNNSASGILVVTARDFRTYKYISRNNALKGSKTAHFIELSFPKRDILTSIIRDSFASKEVKVNDKAIQLFILRMSNAYNDYNIVIDKIADYYKGKTIGFDEMQDGLKGIDNYVLDDFLSELTKGVGCNKLIGRRKIYKMYKSLLDSLSAKDFVSRLKNKVDNMVELRILINDGKIPVLVRYNAKEIQDKLDDESRLKTMSTYSFRKYAYIASKTSLEDWFYMQMILNGNYRLMNKLNKSEDDYNHILLTLMHRNTLNPGRLMNSIGVKSVLDESLSELNAVLYDENVNITEGALEDILTKNKEIIDEMNMKHREEALELEESLRRKKKSVKAKNNKAKSKKVIEDKKEAEENLNIQAAYLMSLINGTA